MPSADLPQTPRIRILDGGLGSELRRRGVQLSARCWSARANLTHRSVLAQIHEDYVRAGVDIVTANTFATSRFVLAGAGLEADFEQINRSAIELARHAADSVEREITVAASMSCLPPSFDTGAYPDPDTESAAYSELASCFVDNGADLVLVEMMQDTQHAPRACRAASASGLPFWIGISCRQREEDGALVAFDDPRQSFAAVLDTLLPFAPAGIAIMHTPLDAIGPGLDELRKRWSGPAGAYAEISYPEDPGARAAGRIDPASYAAAARDWLERGATLIGGCCGTTPAHIAALDALVRT